MMSKPAKWIALTGFTLLAGTAMAQTNSPSTAPPEARPSGSTAVPPDVSSDPAGTSTLFGQLDKDADGSISKVEGARDKGVKTEWSKLDANKDGKLDTAEFAKFEANPTKAPKSMY